MNSNTKTKSSTLSISERTVSDSIWLKFQRQPRGHAKRQFQRRYRTEIHAWCTGIGLLSSNSFFARPYSATPGSRTPSNGPFENNPFRLWQSWRSEIHCPIEQPRPGELG